MKKIVIISGPTASGKTKASISLHQYLKKININSEIVNFDSLCFYRELSIGSAKPNNDEITLAPHHLVGSHSIKNPINASEFRELAIPIINDIWNKNSTPILTGGSGFYLRALIKGMYQKPQESTERKNVTLNNQLNIENMHLELAKVDPLSFKRIHPNDHYRIERAYLYFMETGQKISQQKESISFPYDLNHQNALSCELINFYLDIDKPAHWEIIQKRTYSMITDGLIEEVQEILENEELKNSKTLESVGYKETLEFLSGKIKTTQELIEKISISTRQLAKSQRTFFNKLTPQLKINSMFDQSHSIIHAMTLDFLRNSKNV